MPLSSYLGQKTMNRMDWQKYKDEFTCDGSWRDIYVLNTNAAIWQRFLDFLKSSGIPHSFDGEGKTGCFDDLATYFKEREDHGTLTLAIDINGVTLNCHFFTETEIEIDLDPREITGEDKAVGIFNFIEMLGKTLSLPVRMTPENMDKTPVFEYTPGNDNWSYFPYYRNA